MKRDKEPHNEKYRVEYHINNNSTDVLNMMDGLSMEPEREEEGDRCVYISSQISSYLRIHVNGSD